jgi:hypothetical protein
MPLSNEDRVDIMEIAERIQANFIGKTIAVALATLVPVLKSYLDYLPPGLKELVTDRIAMDLKGVLNEEGEQDASN